MARGVSRNRGSSITKMDAVRGALDALGSDASPKEIQQHIRRHYGVRMDLPMISNYKSSLKRTGKSTLLRRSANRAGAADSTGGGFSVNEIQAVKQVVDQIGADKVQQLARVLGK
jgi:hypothetical protein